MLLAVVQGVSKDWSGLVKTATTLVLGSAAVFGLKKASEVGEKVQSRPDETSTVSYDYVGSEQTDAKKHQFYASLISETQELYHKENRSIQEDYNLRTNIAVLTNAFGDAASSLSSATGDVESFSAAIRDTTTALNEQQKADYNTRKREVLASLSDAFWNADYTGNKAVLSPQARSISANKQGLTPELAAYAAWLIEEKGLFDTTSDAEMARNNLLPGTVLGTLPPIHSTNDLSRLYANDNDSKNDAENVYAMINAAYNDMDYGYGFLAYKNHMAQKSVKDALSSTVQPMLSQHLSSDQADDILSTMWYRINDIVPVSAHTPSDRINEAMQTVFSDM